MAALPASLRGLTPERLRDDVRLRALAVGCGAIPPRRMHSDDDARVLLEAVKGAKRVVEIGVYEGSSALELCEALGPDAELHLVDPFGSHPDALPSGWGATEWATRRAVARAARGGPRVHWHVALSDAVAATFAGEVDLVFIDGDHSYEGCRKDWEMWRAHVAPGGFAAFHDARAGQPGGRGAPGPTQLVDETFRGADESGWTLADEIDALVVVRKQARAG